MTVDEATNSTVRFYSDSSGSKWTSRDAQGRSLEDLWQFSDKELEWNHDYIQVLFPVSTVAKDVDKGMIS
jgi:hypothetical protein